MKQIYAAILLVTFVVGTLQPVIPMVEYQLFEGNIVELFAGDYCDTAEVCEMDCCVSDLDCPNSDAEQNQELLNTDFYPLALDITRVPDPRVFLIGERFDLPIANKVINPTKLPTLPPPWLS